MSDLSKCPGDTCKKKESCLRYTCEPLQKYQHWITMCVSIKVVDECKWFIDNKKEE